MKNLHFMQKTIGCLILCLLCVGCSTVSVSSTKSLHLVVDELLFNEYQSAFLNYRLSNPQISLEIQVLPAYTLKNAEKQQERVHQLAEIRTQSMAGKGPDVYIGYLYGLTEENRDMNLFSDMQKAIYAGAFYDLNRVADISESIGSYPSALLECARIEKSQYFVPLGYAVRGIWLSEENIQNVLKTEDYFKAKNRKEIFEVAPLKQQTELQDAYAKLDLHDLCCPNYNTQTVSLKKQDVLNWAKSKKAWMATEQQKSTSFTEMQFALILCTEPMALRLLGEGETTALTKGSIAFLPLQNKHGGFTAEVQSYFAVNASTKLPQEAFSLLQFLLSKEVQLSALNQNLCQGGFSPNYESHAEFITNQSQLSLQAKQALKQFPLNITQAHLRDDACNLLEQEMYEYWMGTQSLEKCYSKAESVLARYISE